jgi:calcineurin-like phosphoesterase family protein
MKEIFFASDTHFGHANIIKYSNRPFANTKEMDEALITNWNSRVKPTDDIYHLGDFCFGSTAYADYILKQLNGNKFFIFGNHDKAIRDEAAANFKWLRHYYELKEDKQTIVLCHYAMRVWNKSHHGSYMLYGHSHGKLEATPWGKSMDVGVDCHNYFPISLEEVTAIMDKRTVSSAEPDI